MKTMKVAEARRLFARALEAVIRDDEPLIIVRYREPIAAIVPINRLSPAERIGMKRDRRQQGQWRRP